MRKNNNRWLELCFLVVVLMAGAQAVRGQNRPSKPNIILILTDDLGYGDIGVFFQNKRLQVNGKIKPYELTPNIDQLAKQGAQFTQQYCNAPVCAPSRASLLTGLHQGNANVRDNQFDKALENNHTMATVLKTAGYQTVAIGKWGLQGEKDDAPNWPAHPLKRGFDHYFGYIRHRDGHEHYPTEGIYRGKKEVWKDYTNVAEDLSKCYTTDLWTAYAKKWIIDQESRNSTQPFFMYLAYDAPHAVLELPTQAYPKGSGLRGGLQWLNEPGHMINTATGAIDSYIYPEYAAATYDNDSNASTPQVPWPQTYQRYATSTKRIDDAVGDLMQLLKDMHIEDNTLVVFTSDNGPSIESYLPDSFVPVKPTFFSSYGPFDGIKRDCWEGGVRMPTIASWPGHISNGKIINSPSMLSDWLPTFAQAAGIRAPARCDGVSLIPYLTGKGRQEAPLVYVEYYEGGKTPGFKEFEKSRRNRRRGQMQLIRMGNLVGVRYDIQSSNDDFEIYNVVHDPKQTKNLALMAGYSGVQMAMKAKVLQMRRTDSSAKRPYDSAFVPANKVNKPLLKGLYWQFFAGQFPYVVCAKGLTPQSVGTAAIPTGPEGKNRNGLLQYEGYIEAPVDGQYQFTLQAQGKAVIRLHKALLIDADFEYQSATLKTQKVYLKKGFHSVSIYYLKGGNNKPNLKFQYELIQSNKQTNTRLTGFYH